MLGRTCLVAVSIRCFNKSAVFGSKVDRSLVPQLSEADLEEMFVKGHGPGGSAVNTTSNCVVLRHKPTGIVIKCHNSRWLDENRKEARKLLINRLDNIINGDLSVENQLKSIEEKKKLKNERKKRKLKELKEKWKENEGVT